MINDSEVTCPYPSDEHWKTFDEEAPSHYQRIVAYDRSGGKLLGVRRYQNRGGLRFPRRVRTLAPFGPCVGRGINRESVHCFL
jgi:hypothetical protein